MLLLSRFLPLDARLLRSLSRAAAVLSLPTSISGPSPLSSALNAVPENIPPISSALSECAFLSSARTESASSLNDTFLNEFPLSCSPGLLERRLYGLWREKALGCTGQSECPQPQRRGARGRGGRTRWAGPSSPPCSRGVAARSPSPPCKHLPSKGDGG